MRRVHSASCRGSQQMGGQGLAYPGQIALQVMFPFWAISRPTVFVNPAMPCLAAL